MIAPEKVKLFNDKLCKTIIAEYKIGNSVSKYYEKLNLFDITLLYNYDNKCKTEILEALLHGDS